jgi:hypothetical protein
VKTNPLYLNRELPENVERRQWITDHWGELARIARRVGARRAKVQKVFYGLEHSRDGRIEAALIAAGAPHVTPRQSAAA